ncbi:MAG TPA: acetyl-CoA carboxylase carboxyl transferase subunit beta [Clostridiaceae bacterium]|nr:acetyl-CoA carboxylase carboxyl transferase subunit beta [Clostridiaceae bacterium]
MRVFFNKRRNKLEKMDKLTRLRTPAKKKKIPVNVFTSCPKCAKSFTPQVWSDNLYVCPECNKHLRLSVKTRLNMIMDAEYEFIDEPSEFRNPINFPGYEEKWRTAYDNTDSDEAIVFVKGNIYEQPCIVGVMDTNFLMGSLGSIVGERIISSLTLATEEKLPVIIFTASGGARMQEAIISLMQMRYVSAAVGKFQRAGGLYITVMTDPTTGGVTASYASLGNIILTEPGTLIAFAGPRVIRDTIKQELPEGFQTAEHLEKRGFVDRIIERKDMKKALAELLKMHNSKQVKVEFSEVELQTDVFLKSDQKSAEKNTNLTAFDRVKKARDPDRISPKQVLEYLCSDIIELRGDRLYGDDQTIVGGLATLGGLPITYIYTQKGDDLESRIKLNFGMPHPEGYRKARRLMKEAENFGRPILTIIDTPGAYPGIGSENRGMGEAIAQNLRFMSDLKTPTIAIITGEAGSGGAIALACTDKLFMLENAVYTILSPEGFATILWKDVSKVEEASTNMRLTAEDMYELKVCDQIFPDDLTGLKQAIANTFNQLLEEKTKQ